MKKLLKFLSSKLFVVPVLIILQFMMIVIPMQLLDEYSVYANVINRFLSIILAIYIAAKPDNPTYRLTWIMLLLISPFLGLLIYFLFGEKQ